MCSFVTMHYLCLVLYYITFVDVIKQVLSCSTGLGLEMLLLVVFFLSSLWSCSVAASS